MKKMQVIRWTSAVVLTACLWAAAEEVDPVDKLPMQQVKMQNIDGKMMTLEDVKGEKGTLVIFACNHCPFVKAWEKRIADIGNRSKERGIGVVLINANDADVYPTDDLEHMRQQTERAGFKFPYLVDATSDVARAFGAKRTPEVFLYDAKGEQVYHGAIDDNAYKPEEVEQTYLQDAIDALVAGEEVPRKETRSVGCSIKFRPKQEPSK